MVLARLVMPLAVGLTSVGMAFAQEHSPLQANLASAQIFATLTKRAKLFEAKAQLATQCAKGLRLIEKVATLTSPNNDEEKAQAQWAHDTFFLVDGWFTKEQLDEWYFAGKEVDDHMNPQIEAAHRKEEALEIYKREFALIMNAQIAVLKKMSHDLDARMRRIEQARSAE